MMGRLLAAVYGFVCYVTFLGVFLYAIAFVENAVMPKAIDSGTESSRGAAFSRCSIA